MSANAELEKQILDLLCDEDDEFDANAALNSLMYVVAGICCTEADQSPLHVAETFATSLTAMVAKHTERPRLAS